MLSQYKLRKKIDPIIPSLTLVLSVIGLIMILSSSQFQSFQATGNAYYYFSRQLFFWILGLVAFYYFLHIKLENLFESKTKFLYISLILLIVVFIPIIGPQIAGVHRWVDLGFIRFQPSEIVKLLFTIYLAAWLAKKGSDIDDPVKTLVPFIVVLLAIVGLIMLQPDMGTALVIISTAMVVYFLAKVNILQYVALVIVGLLLLLILIYAAPYRLQRLTVFLGQNTSQTDRLGAAYHGRQAQIAIGSGGWWGVGFGQGTSKYSFLPESHNDSIFAVVAEELGFIRTAMFLTIYFYLLFRGYLIVRAANSRFVQLLSAGIVTAIASQLLINIGGMLGLLPLTGVPLPLISYGGTSLTITMAMLGLLTNLSREKI